VGARWMAWERLDPQQLSLSDGKCDIKISGAQSVSGASLLVGAKGGLRLLCVVWKEGSILGVISERT
jgi:hypothetical protein